MAIGILANAVGCGDVLNQRIQLAETLLEEKYGVSFEVYGQKTLACTDTNVYKIRAYPEGKPDLRFEGEVYINSNHVEDEYIGRLIGQAVENKMKENLSSYLSRYEMIVLSGDKYSDSNNIHITIEEYLKEKPKVHFLVYLIVDLEEIQSMSAQQQYNIFQKLFQNLPAINGRLEVFYASEEEIKQVREYKTNMTKIEAGYSDIMQDIHSISSFFEYSNLDMSCEELKKELSK